MDIVDPLRYDVAKNYLSFSQRNKTQVSLLRVSLFIPESRLTCPKLCLLGLLRKYSGF